MKFSRETIDVLKTFAKINPQAVFREGNAQLTLSEGKNVFAIARIPEAIPSKFAIHDLNQFLGVMSLFDEDVDLTFGEKQIVFTGRDGRSTITYRYTPERIIKVPPPTVEQFEKKFGAMTKNVVFDLVADDLKWVRNCANALQSNNIAIESDGQRIWLACFDAQNDAAPVQTLEIATGNGDTFRMGYLASNLQVLPDDYTVSLNESGVLIMHAKNRGVDFYFAAEINQVAYVKK